jgi:multidrug resistance protein
MVTMITVIYAAAQFFAAPLLGKLSDRHGRRPVLLFSVFGSAIGYVIFGFGGALWVLFLSRVIDGITGGNLSTASSYIADISTPETRARNFTLIGMAYGFGFIVGPALGTAFSQISLAAPAFVAAGLSLVGFLMACFVLPESLPKERREETPLRPVDFNPLASIGSMARKPGLGLVLLVYCLFEFAFNGTNAVTVLFLIQKFNADSAQVGLLFVVAGIATAVTQAVIVPKMVPRFGEKATAMVGMVAQGLGLLLMVVAPSFWMIYPIVVLSSAIGGFIYAPISSLTVSQVSPREQGVLMGVSAALVSLMGVLGPLWSGLLFDHVAPASPYWIGAIILAVGAFLISRAQPKPASSMAADATAAW